MLEEVFLRKIPITEGGSKHDVTILEAIMRRLANGAAKGEIRSIDLVLKLLPLLQEHRSATQADAENATQVNSATDLPVLGALAHMFGSEADNLFACQTGGDEVE